MRTLNDLKQAKKLILNSFDILMKPRAEKKYLNALKSINDLILLEEGKRKYQFYFEYKKDGERHNVEIKACKNPMQTKVYKQLEENFQAGFIEVYGYEQIK